MQIWAAEIIELERLYDSLKGQFPELEKELGHLIKTEDENVALLYSRRCLEIIITNLCECELKRPRKTEPLKGIIDKLSKEEKVPFHIIASMHSLNSLSTFGAHPKDFDPEQVKPVLVNLDIIIKWYLKYKNIVTIGKAEVEEGKFQLRDEPLDEVPVISEGTEFYDNSNKDLIYPAHLEPFISFHGKKKSNIFSSETIWSKGINKFFLTLLILASITGLVFGWKGLTKLGGVKESERELARSHVASAVEYFDGGYYEEARVELESALRSDPKYSYAWSSMAAVSVKQGKLNDAISQTIEAVKYDPTNSQAAFNMAIALDDKNDFKQAIYWYKEAIRIDSTLKKDSTYIPASSALGRLYTKMDQPINAILLLSRAKDQYPESKHIYLVYKNLGNAYLVQEQIDTALKYLELSNEIKPEERETNLYLAKACEAAGKITRSIEHWQTYIELETDTVRKNKAKSHLREITVKHLQEIIK